MHNREVVPRLIAIHRDEFPLKQLAQRLRAVGAVGDQLLMCGCSPTRGGIEGCLRFIEPMQPSERVAESDFRVDRARREFAGLEELRCALELGHRDEFASPRDRGRLRRWIHRAEAAECCVDRRVVFEPDGTLDARGKQSKCHIARGGRRGEIAFQKDRERAKFGSQPFINHALRASASREVAEALLSHRKWRRKWSGRSRGGRCRGRCDRRRRCDRADRLGLYATSNNNEREGKENERRAKKLIHFQCLSSSGDWSSERRSEMERNTTQQNTTDTTKVGGVDIQRMGRASRRVSATCLVGLPNLNISESAADRRTRAGQDFEADAGDVLDRGVRVGEFRAVEIEMLVIESRHDLGFDDSFQRRESGPNIRRRIRIDFDRDGDSVVVAVSIRVVALPEECPVVRIRARGEVQPMGRGKLKGLAKDDARGGSERSLKVSIRACVGRHGGCSIGEWRGAFKCGGQRRNDRAVGFDRCKLKFRLEKW